MRPCSLRTLVGSLNVNIHYQVPILILHVLEADIAQDACIVDEDIDSTKVLDSCLDDLLAIGDAVIVGCCFAASGFDFIDDDIGCLYVD